jgi:AcrR family transcriptional regulator
MDSNLPPRSPGSLTFSPTRKRRVKHPRRPQARSATTRRNLLDAACGLLGEVGYQQFTTDLVAATADVSRGAVQHHFGSRDNLILAIVEDLGQQLAVKRETSTNAPITQRLSDAIDHDWNVLRSPHFAAVMQIWLAERGNATLFPKIRDMATAIERQLDERWTQVFSDSGLSAADIVTLRHVVLSTLRGLCLRSIFHGDNTKNSEELAALKVMANEFIRKKA